METHPLIICFVLLLGMSSGNASANPCDSRYVADEGVSVKVRHSGGFLDDDVNVQCAVDFAISEGVPTVQLTTGDYYFGTEVSVEGYDGTIRGTGMEERTLVHDHGFEFSGGSPTLENLQIKSNEFGVEVIAGRNCNKPTFISLNRVKIIARDRGVEVSTSQCDFKGTVNIHRSWIEGSDALFLSELKAGSRVSLTNTDFRAEAGACIFSESNHIALSAVSNSCVAWYMLRLYGSRYAPTSDYYLRGNMHAGAEIYIEADYQPLTIHLQGNRMARTQVVQGNNVSLGALNNIIDTEGEFFCISAHGGTSLIAGNTCATSSLTDDLLLKDTSGSTVNQPTLSLLSRQNTSLLTNSTVRDYSNSGSGSIGEGNTGGGYGDAVDTGFGSGDGSEGGGFVLPDLRQFCAAGRYAPGTDSWEWDRQCNCDGTVRDTPAVAGFSSGGLNCGT